MKKLRNYDSAPGCSMEAALHILGGKWKGVILFHLFKDGTLRFSELQRHLVSINQRLLTKQLRDLEDEGRELQDLIMDLSLWGKKWLEKRGMKTAADEDLDTLKAVFTKQSH